MNDVPRQLELLLLSQQKTTKLLSKQSAQLAALTAACSALIAASPVRKEAAALISAMADKQRPHLQDGEALTTFDQTIAAVIRLADHS